jgi:dehydrogenase/reductase SDR family protein 1
MSPLSDRAEVGDNKMKSLKGKIAIVTGASRGVGKGIALGLAEYGATVYVTGRTENDAALPEFLKKTTIYDTEKAINQAGGIGIAHRCDHSNDEEVRQLFERVQKEQGRLDILVNNAWSGASHIMNDYFWNTPFWEQPMSLFDDFNQVGLRSSYLASQHAARIMTKQKSGLIANISFHSAYHYWINVSHGLFKAATDKFTADAAYELKDFGVKVFSIYPGTVRTEGMLEFAKYNPSIRVEDMESPQYVGRCISELALDNDSIEQTGKVTYIRDC